MRSRSLKIPEIKTFLKEGSSSLLQSKCLDCSKKCRLLQRSSLSRNSPEKAPHIVKAVLGSSGKPLDKYTLKIMEPKFGYDFSQVRIHDDGKAADSARAVNALAYTVGRDLVFGFGKYSPRSSEGQNLIAHELTHVVQQSRWQVPDNNSRDIEIGDQNDFYENCAERISGRFNPETSEPYLAPSRPKLQRKVVCDQEKPDICWSVPDDEPQSSEQNYTPVSQEQSCSEQNNSQFDQDQVCEDSGPVTSNPEVDGDQQSAYNLGQVVADFNAQSFPQSLIKFNSFDEGGGVILNPEFWSVSYIITKKGERLKTFRASGRQSAFNAADLYRQENPRSDLYAYTNEADKPYYTIEIAVGGNGAAAAIRDVYNPGSDSLYGFECFTAASLMTLGGIYQSYVLENKSEDEFNERYDSFSIVRGKETMTSLIDNDLEDIEVSSFSLGDFDRDPRKYPLNAGDWVYIYNPQISAESTNAFRGENAIYLGGNLFKGHPLDMFTPIEFAQVIIKRGVAPELMTSVEDVLRQYRIDRLMRPVKNQ
jgi:hypothetical protein